MNTKTEVFRHKNRKTDQKNIQNRKTENLNAPLFEIVKDALQLIQGAWLCNSTRGDRSKKNPEGGEGTYKFCTVYAWGEKDL